MKPGSLGRKHYPDMSTEELQKYKNYLSNIAVLGVIWFAAACFLVYVWTDKKAMLPLLFAAMFVVCGVGCFVRLQVFRVLGIILSVLMLLSFPTGTILGIFGLISFGKGSKLYGPDAIDRKLLLKELKHREEFSVR